MPERKDDEYDRKIVLFAMLAADVLIINNKGEMQIQMINTMQICCHNFGLACGFHTLISLGCIAISAQGKVSTTAPNNIRFEEAFIAAEKPTIPLLLLFGNSKLNLVVVGRQGDK